MHEDQKMEGEITMLEIGEPPPQRVLSKIRCPQKICTSTNVRLSEGTGRPIVWAGNVCNVEVHFYCCDCGLEFAVPYAAVETEDYSPE